MSDMGEKPEGYSIDRIDPNGHYEPANCRWVLLGQQQRNKRNNVRITFHGETMCLTEWAERVGLKPKTLRARIFDHKMPIEAALTIPLRRRV